MLPLADTGAGVQLNVKDLGEDVWEVSLNTKYHKNYQLTIKGTVKRDFLPPVFSSFKPALGTGQRVKHFCLFVKISPSYSILHVVWKKLTPRSIILWGVKDNLVLELFSKKIECSSFLVE